MLTYVLYRWAQPASTETALKQLKQGRASSPHTESAFRHSLSDQGAKTSIATTGRSPTRAQRAAALGRAANGPSPPSSPIRAVLGRLGAEDADRRAVASTLEGCEGAVSLKAMMQRQPFRHQPHLEYYAMPPGVKVCKQSTVETLQEVAVSTGTVSATSGMKAWLPLQHMLYFPILPWVTSHVDNTCPTLCVPPLLLLLLLLLVLERFKCPSTV